jgi:hypothetical protein
MLDVLYLGSQDSEFAKPQRKQIKKLEHAELKYEEHC